MFILFYRKASTRKGKKALLALEPKLIEEAKQCFLIQGRKTSDTTKGIMKDLYTLKKPNVVMFQRKNDLSPFEDATLLEKYIIYLSVYFYLYFFIIINFNELFQIFKG